MIQHDGGRAVKEVPIPLDSLELRTSLQRAGSQEELEITGPIRNGAGFALFVMIQRLLMLSLLAAYVIPASRAETGGY